MLTDEEIVAVRDQHLPSQGEVLDCLAFGRALLDAALLKGWRQREGWNAGSMIDVAWVDPRDNPAVLQSKLDGVRLYDHAYSCAPGETKPMTLWELETLGVVRAITLHAETY